MSCPRAGEVCNEYYCGGNHNGYCQSEVIMENKMVSEKSTEYEKGYEAGTYDTMKKCADEISKLMQYSFKCQICADYSGESCRESILAYFKNAK